MPSLFSISENIGIRVVFNATPIIVLIIPVADRATKNVSVSNPEPNFAAINTSLINPNNLLPRDNITIRITDLAAFLNLLIIAS